MQSPYVYRPTQKVTGQYIHTHDEVYAAERTVNMACTFNSLSLILQTLIYLRRCQYVGIDICSICHPTDASL